MTYAINGESFDRLFFTDVSLIYPYLSTSKLMLWGNNAMGQIGDNTIASRSSPVQVVTGGTTWSQIDAGEYHSAAIKSDGTLWVWGDNSINPGTLGDSTNTSRSSPVQTVAGGTTWKQVACGYALTAAVKTDGTLWTWGQNTYGQLGDNTSTGKSSPVQTVTGGTTWKQVSCGKLFTSAVKTDGTLWTWGNNSSGQLGDGTVTHKSSPAQTVASSTSWSQVSCGYFHTGAIKTDGTLWLWGKNTSGQLGDNTVSSRSSPVQTVAGGTTWSQLSCGYDFTAAIKTDGTLWLWGNNAYGQLGDNTNAVNKSSPIQTITGGTTWKSVSADWWNTGAVKTDGTLWMWGHNAYGQLGDNTVAAKSSPIQTVAGGTNWRTVACGYRHTLAITN
jgi:alpha-tubulin suppressor-like RCC1 family protein